MNEDYLQIERDGEIYLRVCMSRDVFEARGKNIYFDDEVQVALFRSNGQLYAVSNICLHQHAAVICDGFVDELTVRCPLHGWVYSLETGKTHGSRSQLQTYQVWEENGYIFIEKPKPIIPKWMDSL